MLLLLVVICSLAASAHADCDACIDGWCHSRKTLIEGFHITDQLAIDHTHNVLYVQLDSTLNTAFFLNDLKIKMVPLSNTTGMTVDQVTQDLYIAEHKGSIYKFKYGNNTPDMYSSSTAVNLLFFKDELYYTAKAKTNKGINYITKDNKYFYITELDDLELTITDFVVNKDNKVYYVANDKVYVYPQPRFMRNSVVQLITDKRHVLSTDKHGDVYLAGVKTRAIYKLNESDELVEYAAYKTGSVDRFVFDINNNIIYHDAADGNIYTWKKGLAKCETNAPVTNYIINELSSRGH